jgi:hypothetical protein
VLRYIVQLFIVFLMLYKYNSLKKQQRVLPPNGISSNYQSTMIATIHAYIKLLPREQQLYNLIKPCNIILIMPSFISLVDKQ